MIRLQPVELDWSSDDELLEGLEFERDGSFEVLWCFELDGNDDEDEDGFVEFALLDELKIFLLIIHFNMFSKQFSPKSTVANIPDIKRSIRTTR